MSDDNVETVRRVVDATNRRDPDAFVAALSPDVEWEDDLFGTEGGRTYRGAAEVREWLNQVWEPWKNLHMEALEITPGRDGRVFVEFELTARGKESGAETHARFWTVSEIAEGKIRTRQTFRDRAQALEATGLAEAE
jgi:ketosteroid isomerase-like protein